MRKVVLASPSLLLFLSLSVRGICLPDQKGRGGAKKETLAICTTAPLPKGKKKKTTTNDNKM